MLRGCRVINFTRYYPLAQRWEGVDHMVHLDGPEGAGEPDEDEACLGDKKAACALGLP
jgi:hypothetical protein